MMPLCPKYKLLANFNMFWKQRERTVGSFCLVSKESKLIRILEDYPTQESCQAKVKRLQIWALLCLISYSLVPRKSNTSGGWEIVTVPGVSWADFHDVSTEVTGWERSQTATLHLTLWRDGSCLSLKHTGMLGLTCRCPHTAFVHSFCLLLWTTGHFVHFSIALLKRWLPPLGELSPYLQKSSHHFSACSDLNPRSDFCSPLWLWALVTCLCLLPWVSFGLCLGHCPPVSHSVLCS